MKLCDGEAGAIAVEELGTRTGVPIVLIHGMAGDAGFWGDVIAALEGSRRLVVPELRGHGRSGTPANADYSIESNAADLLGVLAQLGLDRYVLVGHSFGASVAIEMAARAPDRVAGLVVVDGAGDFSHIPSAALAGFIAGLASDHEFEATVDGAYDVALAGARPETERRVRAAMLAAPRPLVRSVYQSLLSYRPTAALDRYKGPVLLVTAPVNSASFALHALRPLLRRESMPGVSHWVMMDEPGRFVAILEEFLSGIAP
jgi:pimeloyl-ACP methyl ester carboxylesterase